MVRLLPLVLLAAPGRAAVYLTQSRALELAFPKPMAVERRTAYLTEEQARRIEASARARLESRVWSYYVARSSRGVEGYAYFESHVVRTMPETFMAVLDASGRLRFVELLTFHEPEDYRPPKRWLRLFEGKSAGDDLAVRRGLRNVAGATLTSHALAAGVRRVLAVHQALREEERNYSAPPTENSPPRGGRIPDALPPGEGVGSVGGGPK